MRLQAVVHVHTAVSDMNDLRESASLVLDQYFAESDAEPPFWLMPKTKIGSFSLGHDKGSGKKGRQSSSSTRSGKFTLSKDTRK